jgi:hemoglobin
MAFSIGEPERDSWITHMKSALDSMQINDEERYEITRYFDYTATLLMNR